MRTIISSFYLVLSLRSIVFARSVDRVKSASQRRESQLWEQGRGGGERKQDEKRDGKMFRNPHVHGDTSA